MNCLCGHSEAAHQHTPTRECAFCLCRGFTSGDDADLEEKPAEPDEVQDALAILAEHPAFVGIDAVLLDALAERGRKRTILRDAMLFDKGDPSDRLFLVLRGEVAVDREARGAIPELSVILGPGNPVGEIGLLHGAPHTATAVALDDLHVLEFSERDIHGLFREHHALRLAFMRMMHYRMQPPPS